MDLFMKVEVGQGLAPILLQSTIDRLEFALLEHLVAYCQQQLHEMLLYFCYVVELMVVIYRQVIGWLVIDNLA
jgi:hypothetical protein